MNIQQKIGFVQNQTYAPSHQPSHLGLRMVRYKATTGETKKSPLNLDQPCRWNSSYRTLFLTDPILPPQKMAVDQRWSQETLGI